MGSYDVNRLGPAALVSANTGQEGSWVLRHREFVITKIRKASTGSDRPFSDQNPAWASSITTLSSSADLSGLSETTLLEI